MRDKSLCGKAKKAIVVAEISANHGQDFDRAIRLIRAARACGADAVKFQAYTPDTLTIDSAGRYFRIRHPRWGGQTLYELYGKAYTPWKWFAGLKACAEREGLGFFATSFDRSSVDFLEDLGVKVHKTASFELVDTPFIRYLAGTGKPLIMSTGMASAAEISRAIKAARGSGCGPITLLKCVSSYPADPDEMNLRTIPDMIERFGCPVGLSDHGLDPIVPVAAVSVGASMIEKHFTLSRKYKTPDSFFSMEPKEMMRLVRDVRSAERCLGRVNYDVTAGEAKNLVFRRSLFAVRDVPRGGLLTEENIRSIRPAYGISPEWLDRIIGLRSKRSIRRGTPISLSHFRSGKGKRR